MPFLHQSSAKDAAQHGLAWLEVPADRFTPVGLFLSMRASGRRPCLLESAEGPLRLARWSLLEGAFEINKENRLSFSQVIQNRPFHKRSPPPRPHTSHPFVVDGLDPSFTNGRPHKKQPSRRSPPVHGRGKLRTFNITLW